MSLLTDSRWTALRNRSEDNYGTEKTLEQLNTYQVSLRGAERQSNPLVPGPEEIASPLWGSQ